MKRVIIGALFIVAGTFAISENAPAIEQASRPTASATVTLAVPGRSNATPWIAAMGSHVAIAWGATADGKTDVFVAVSEDGGHTFGPPRQVNTVPGEARLGGEMPPRVQWRTRGAQPPELAILWTARGATTEIRLSRSLDNGKTFSPPVSLQQDSAAGDRGWPALAVDSGGIVHAIWLDHRGLAARDPAAAHSEHKEHDGALMAQRSGLYHVAVGARPSVEQRVTTGVCYCCKTALATGAQGELYAAWRHVYAGNIRDIAFSTSRNGGPFTSPVRVSEDHWQLNGCPDDGPAMTVDKSGTVHIVWPTVLNEPEPQGALLYATTRDGKTFTARVRIPTHGSPKPSHPQVAVDSEGRVFIAWDEVLQGTRRAFVRSATNRGGKIEFGAVVALDGDAPSMYPVIVASEGGAIVVWTAGTYGSSVIRIRRL